MDGAALSALDWWTEAGVDTLVDDVPFDWLAKPTVPSAAEPVAVPAAAAPSAAALPGRLAEFRRWLLADASVPGAVRARLDARGDPARGAAIVLDMPEAEDRAAAALLSGEVGALFDRMLGAIGLDRDAVYLIPFAPARPASGRLDEREQAALAPLLRHHLALAAPARLLLLGDAPAHALLGRSALAARGATHQIALEGRTVPAIASLHPRLVRSKEARASAWADLQAFAAL